MNQIKKKNKTKQEEYEINQWDEKKLIIVR